MKHIVQRLLRLFESLNLIIGVDFRLNRLDLILGRMIIRVKMPETLRLLEQFLLHLKLGGESLNLGMSCDPLLPV
ncbi:hypothetical protein D3C72_1974850 [compost metagenome]